MSKFGFLKRTHIPAGSEGWRWMELPEVGPDCKLLLANATAENKEMLEEALRVVESRRGDRGAVSLSKLEKAIEQDRVILHKHLLRGWEGMWEQDPDTGDYRMEDGDKVPILFSPENAWDFLEQCPDWLIAVIRDWCKAPENFTAGGPPITEVPDANAVGNS